MFHVTLDNNAIIALANNEPDAVHLKPLIDFHRQGTISLSIGVVTLLEDTPQTAADSPEIVVAQRIAAAGLDIPEVHLYRSPQFLAFFCQSCHTIFYDDDISRQYAVVIHQIMCQARNIDFDYHTYRQRRAGAPEEKIQKRWFNAKNDALGLFNHVTWNGDIFVTSDNDFLKKRAQLARLVPGKILSPQETLEELSQTTPESGHQEASWLPRLTSLCWKCRHPRL